MTTRDVTVPANAAKNPAALTGTVPEMARIGEVAKLTGVTTRTLRYWEEPSSSWWLRILVTRATSDGEYMRSPPAP